MINVSIDNLMQVLKTKNLEPKVQSETQQIYLIFKINDREFPLFIRIFHESDLLQLLVFIPCNLKPETLSDVARLLHLFNKELDIPGFGMDEDTGVVFFRCVVPTAKHKISESVLDAFLNTMQLVCKTFAQPIDAVAFGATTFDDIMKKAKEMTDKGTPQA